MCIFGSAICSLVLNVDTSEVTTTKYNYVTDVTGLFEHTDAPQYTEFSPIANYTGYTNTTANTTNPSGIDFERTNTANNYTILVNPATAASGPSGTVDNGTSLPQFSFPLQPVIPLSPGDSALVNDTTITGRIYDFKVTSVYDWLLSIWPGLQSLQKITLNFTYPGGAPNHNALFCSGTYVHSGTGELMLTVIGQQSNAVQSATVDVSNYTITFDYLRSDNTVSTRTVSVYDAYLCYGDARQRENYFTTTGGQISAQESYYNTAMSLSFTSEVTSGAEYAYLIPAAGVTLGANGSGYFDTIWSNGEHNGAVSILIDGWDYSAASHAGIKIIAAGQTIEISRSDIWQINGHDIGSFARIIVIFDFINGQLIVKPVNFSTFTDYEIVDTVLFSEIIPSGEITDMHFMQFDGLQPLRWSIAETVVSVTDGIVMVNPSLTITDYWPEMTYYRLWLQSVAVFGDSVTLNGVTYPINADGDIRINDKNYNFNNVYLSYPADDHLYLTFGLGSVTIDLGSVESKTIEFGGAWYFQMGLYEGTETTETAYTWSTGWGATAPQFILISLGLLAAAVVAVRRVYGLQLTVVDWGTIIIGVVILLTALGGYVD